MGGLTVDAIEEMEESCLPYVTDHILLEEKKITSSNESSLLGLPTLLRLITQTLLYSTSLISKSLLCAMCKCSQESSHFIIILNAGNMLK